MIHINFEQLGRRWPLHERAPSGGIGQDVIDRFLVSLATAQPCAPLKTASDALIPLLPAISGPSPACSRIITARPPLTSAAKQAAQGGQDELVYLPSALLRDPSTYAALTPQHFTTQRYGLVLPTAASIHHLKPTLDSFFSERIGTIPEGIVEAVAAEILNLTEVGSALFGSTPESIKLVLEGPLESVSTVYPDWFHQGHWKRLLCVLAGAGTIGVPRENIASWHQPSQDIETVAAELQQTEREIQAANPAHSISQALARSYLEPLWKLFTQLRGCVSTTTDPLIQFPVGSAIAFPAQTPEALTFVHREPIDRRHGRFLVIIDFN